MRVLDDREQHAHDTRCQRQDPQKPDKARRQEDGGDGRSGRTHAELGRFLTAAAGYRVLASDGTYLGWLDHVRYERYADHPDELIISSRRHLATRRRVLPFSAVAEVRQRDRTVVVRGTRTE